jgi:hypothetical protein
VPQAGTCLSTAEGDVTTSTKGSGDSGTTAVLGFLPVVRWVIGEEFVRIRSSRPGEIRMRNFATVAAVFLTSQAIVVSVAMPAAAISADLAKRCREMAIKAHPPPIPPGNKAYAQSQRDFFRECVARNGEMPSTGAARPPANQK